MKIITKVCRTCGKPFDTKKSHKVFCTDDCSNKWKNAMYRKDFVSALSTLWDVELGEDNKSFSTDVADSELTTETVSRLITERTV